MTDHKTSHISELDIPKVSEINLEDFEEFRSPIEEARELLAEIQERQKQLAYLLTDIENQIVIKETK